MAWFKRFLAGHKSVEPAQRESDTSTATKTGQGFSDCWVIEAAL
jgi:hypothetical protein